MGRRTSKAPAKRPGGTSTRMGGRPTALTPRVEETLLGYLADGLPIETSCNLAGVSPAAYYRWMERGEIARETLDQTGDCPEDENRFREFREAALSARSQSVRKMVGIVHRSAEGGQLLSEEPIVDIQGIPQYDHDGKLLVRRTFSAPNGNLALRFLERARPADWSIRAQVQHTGANGGPVQVEHSVSQMQSLSARLQEVRDEQGQVDDEDAAIGDYDVVPGEVTSTRDD